MSALLDEPFLRAVQRSCDVKGLDVATAWAVAMGADDHRKRLFGVRATESEAQNLARRVRTMGARDVWVARTVALVGRA